MTASHKEFFAIREELSEKIAGLEKAVFKLDSAIEKNTEKSDELSNYMWAEYELTLSASKILKSYLEQMGFKVIMTRETNDVNITNSERATFANENNADLVIRIHADGSEDQSVSGASLHIRAQNGQYTSKIYPKSNECAEIMMASMRQAGFKVNNIYQRSDLTGFNWSEVPAVLVEMGYMSNPEEDQKMSQTSYQEKMMKSIAEATQKYFNQN